MNISYYKNYINIPLRSVIFLHVLFYFEYIQVCHGILNILFICLY